MTRQRNFGGTLPPWPASGTDTTPPRFRVVCLGEANSFPPPNVSSDCLYQCLEADKLPRRMWSEEEKSLLVFVKPSVSPPCSLYHKSPVPSLGIIRNKSVGIRSTISRTRREIMKGYYWGPKRSEEHIITTYMKREHSAI